MIIISYAGYLSLSLVILVQFAVEISVAAWNHKKSLKTHFFQISTSFKVINVGTPESLSAVLAMVSSKSMSTCNRFHAKLVDISSNHAW